VIAIRNTDCLNGLRTLAAEGRQVHAVVTSPPYWGLRDYGIEPIEWPSGWVGVWGLEPTFQQYIENTLEQQSDGN
jgi:DNA modification methylase